MAEVAARQNVWSGDKKAGILGWESTGSEVRYGESDTPAVL